MKTSWSIHQRSSGGQVGGTRTERPRLDASRGAALPNGDPRRAFTMIEIAVALGIIAFALVAVIGILPSGLQLQKQTRERSIIDKEADYWISAIRGGLYRRALFQGVSYENDLVDFVERITIPDAGVDVTSFVNSGQIIGLLSRTNVVVDRFNDAIYRFDPVTAIIRPVNSSAIERGSLHQDLAFRYQMNVHISPSLSIRPDHPNYAALQDRLWDLKLEFGWPVINGVAIRTQAVYRASITGTITNLFFSPRYTFFKP